MGMAATILPEATDTLVAITRETPRMDAPTK
jgi:hypothetical protein